VTVCQKGMTRPTLEPVLHKKYCVYTLVTGLVNIQFNTSRL